MPSRTRNKTTPAHPLVTTAMPFPAGEAPTTTTIARGRTATAARGATGRAAQFGSVKALQFLSLPRNNANQVLGTLKASSLVNYVNLICTIESAQPGFIAQNPEWAYTVGAQMFGTE
jgi:hypothetical protein